MGLQATLTNLIDRLDSEDLADAHVIKWGSPVLAFGDVASAAVATVGLNPSNREFMDPAGYELHENSRRFHTLRSLDLTTWSDAHARHLRLILESYHSYFSRNPYDLWFRRMDQVLSGTTRTFYGARGGACHLDLIPYATARKWTDLGRAAKRSLLAAAGDTLGVLLRDSPIRVIVLNGHSVVREFEGLAGVRLDSETVAGWSLPRKRHQPVTGRAFAGLVREVGGVTLHKSVLALGFNHNLQSSFGVTKEVLVAIRRWVGRLTLGILH